MSRLSIFILLVLMFPIACLFSSAPLSVALFAKSYKEAQSYITPLMFLVILPARISFLRGLELDWRLVLIPIVNISLAAKEILMGTYKGGGYLLDFHLHLYLRRIFYLRDQKTFRKRRGLIPHLKPMTNSYPLNSAL